MSQKLERGQRSYFSSHDLRQSFLAYDRHRGFDFLLNPGNQRKPEYYYMLRLAHFFLDMPQSDRALLEVASDTRWSEVDPIAVSEAVRGGLETSRKKLRQVGFSPNSHMRFIDALIRGDQRDITTLIARSEEKMKRKKNGVSEAEIGFQLVYDAALMKTHQPFIDEKLSSVRHSGKPFMLLLVGATGGGKTEILKLKLSLIPGSYYHIDPDGTRPLLFPDVDERNQSQIERVRPILWGYLDNELDQGVRAGYSVVMETTLANLNTWLNHPSIARAKEMGYDIEVIVVERPFPDSWRRTTFRDKRLVAPADFWRSTWGYANVVPFARRWGASVKVYSYVEAFKEQTGLDPQSGKDAERALREYKAQHPDSVEIIDEFESMPILK